jgi:type VI secretion system protein ImpH
MVAEMGRETDAITFFASLAAEPYRHDFYQVLRRLECMYADKPRWGHGLKPVDEPIRLGQEPDLAFAPAPLASFDQGEDGQLPRLQVRLFGLLGPNGPLPIHITEYVRERARHAGDITLTRFLDVFHHRFLALFYRAWAQAQPHVNRDRPDEDRFTTYVGALIGLSPQALRDRDSLPDLAKFFHAGTLARQVRNAEGLAGILEHFFRVPVRIQEFVAHWLPVSERDRTYLGREPAFLGLGAVLGQQVWDGQHKFRIRLGPLTLAQYESFLPAGALLGKLADWVRFYFSFEFDYDVCLVLKKNEVPSIKLGQSGQLGWTGWLGGRLLDEDADDLYLNAEAFANSGVSA